METGLETVMADAFKKIKIEEVKLVSNELDNGLTLSLINKLIFSNHAKMRARDRFNIKNEIDADKIVREALKTAVYIGIVPASDGNESHLYVHDGMGIHISLDYKNINTLVKYGEHYISDVLNKYDDIKTAFVDFQVKEMKKLSKKRKTLKKNSIENKFDYNVEIAELDRKMFKTKSEKLRVKYLERKLFLINELKNQEESLEKIEQKIRRVGGSLACLHK